jgi:hypothetical protein
MSYTESLVNDVLANPFDHEWSIQGFGMLRTYLDDERMDRLHIWDAEQAVDDVSTIHDHPWDFSSRIVRGHLKNQRYDVDAEHGAQFMTQQIVCGVGGHSIGVPRPTLIRPHAPEVYRAGEQYGQEATEFHESFPSRGAVTVITRSFKADRDIATVCWRNGDWVSAEPRPATRAEIDHFIALARAASSPNN